ITVITRKAFGGAYIVMGSKKLGADFNAAWPTAQIGGMGAQGAVNILYRRELSNVADNGGGVETRRKELIDDYEAALLHPYEAADSGSIGVIIAPSATRAQVLRALCGTTAKRESRPARKHVTIPL